MMPRRPQPRRRKKTSAIFIGEGSDDEEFLRYIKKIVQKDRRSITLDNGGGGAPLAVLYKLIHNPKFDNKRKNYMLIDNDRSEKEYQAMLQFMRSEHKCKNVTVFYSKKCFEEEILKFFDTEKQIQKNKLLSSQKLKKRFKQHCQNPIKDYPRKLPKDKLQGARIENDWIDSIIKVFE